jgi:hypothetical protein
VKLLCFILFYFIGTIATPEKNPGLIEKANIYTSPRNDYEEAVNNAAVKLVQENSALVFQRGML